MIQFKCEVKGLSKLEKDINKIIKELPQKLEENYKNK